MMMLMVMVMMIATNTEPLLFASPSSKHSTDINSIHPARAAFAWPRQSSTELCLPSAQPPLPGMK